ncbi:YccV-like-domain-containing protein [Bimuria novae-zelandiae CBS 107.79]|uniref:YccV-like-domain-containing protein n=1 Tax=Bimuria novae-zelandiae CBS 107.79 TaxID=1447943 RepID=A0A6A5UV61_9PLEO|nr:YccV-like-domain-containing protein [Bimuria novae-zelandiae CBS 107.79]
MAPAFTDLPAEILEGIFLNLDPQSVISVAQTCRLIKELTTDAPLIWRHFCHTHFRWWDPQRAMQAKFQGPLSDVDWRSVFIERLRKEREALRLLDHVLGSQQNRIRHIGEIADFGYDVKEVLLKEIACDDVREDVLARRYYANAILERIQREMAVEVWASLSRGENVPIEKALAAYDVFTRTGEDVDFETVSHDLGDLAKDLRQQYPKFDGMCARAKASTLATFLREHGFRGVSDSSYRALPNSFIGLVLRSETHDSLPLISVAIYCALARRVGLDARPCGFLFHVYCLIYAPKDHTLDGLYKPTSSSDLDYMYLDPFRSSDEVLANDLQRSLREMGVPPSQHSAYLSDSTTRDMVTRTARNIMNSVQTIRQADAQANGIHSTWFNAHPDMDNAFYATIWAMLILSPDDHGGLSNHPGAARRRQYLPYLLEHFQTHFPWDVALLVQHVIPMFSTVVEGDRLASFVDSRLRIDGMAKPRKRRQPGAADSMVFRVGQLFRHKRYHYEGVITGWDTVCDAGEEWIHHMGVDQLSGGRNQAFYHVMVCDKSSRYVAEENIVPCEKGTEPSEAMLRLAGRHFKRWDAENGVFVSNVRDEYPDD